MRECDVETGYVFYHIDPGCHRSVLERVKAVRGVSAAHVVIGIWDMVVRVEAASIDALEAAYFTELNQIEGVANSRLHIVACPRTRK